MTTEQNPMNLSYSEFVARLAVKPDDLPGKLMHAAIGCMGEAVELHYATSRENEIEELGDYEFYYQFLFNVCPAVPGVLVSSDLIRVKDLLTTGAASEALIYWSNELLDSCKKHWVYNKPLEQLNLLAIVTNIRTCLEAYYKHSGLTYDQVVHHNRLKLVQRFPGAVYTDEAAQRRADKENAQ